MHELCKRCLNEGCKAKEELRLSKVDVCIDMEEHPENWEDYDPFYVEVDDWWKE
jgi:predicted metal-binding protein